MLISPKLRMVFVHVPKTGGVSIQQFLDSHVDDPIRGNVRHARLGYILRNHPETVDYFSFGFVRNPWKRMVSWYAMMDAWNRTWGPASGKPQVERGGMKDGNEQWRAVAGYADFEEFVMRGPDELPRVGLAQLDYLTARRKQVDFIGRTETLGADLVTVATRLGLPAEEPPHRNRSKHGSHTDYYNDRTRRRVAEVYAKDIDAFGYTFEG